MAQTVAPDPAATGAKSLPARILGVIFAPKATYADVAAKPRVLGVLAVVIAVLIAATFAFLSTEVGQAASLENQVQQMQAFGGTVNDAQYARMERMAPYSKYFAAVIQLVTLPLFALVVAGIAFAVFNAILGGDATFKHVYAIVAHSGVILIVQALFALPMAYARETMSSAANLGVFFPFLEENTFAARMLGSIDLFLVWWIVSLSIGLGVLYRRRTGPIATTTLLLYVAIGLIIAAIKTAASGA
jgi:Yip1 domain